MNSNDNNQCIHKWNYYSTYRQCSKCCKIEFSPEMSIINGIISDENDDEQIIEDEEEHTDVLPSNDTHD